MPFGCYSNLVRVEEATVVTLIILRKQKLKMAHLLSVKSRALPRNCDSLTRFPSSADQAVLWNKKHKYHST